MDALPSELDAEREALLREIDEAFDGVSREGDPSWSDAEWADILHEHSPQRLFARMRDTDSRWQDLPEDSVWVSEFYPGSGPWGFLDAAAYRYYLAAAIVVCLRTNQGLGFDDLLTLSPLNERTDPQSESLRLYQMNQWSRLDDRQRRCVYRFLLTMREIIRILGKDTPSIEGWTEAIDRYWGQYAESVSPHAQLGAPGESSRSDAPLRKA